MALNYVDRQKRVLIDGTRLGHFDRLSPYCDRVGRFSWQGYMVYNSATCERKVAKDVKNGIPPIEEKEPAVVP